MAKYHWVRVSKKSPCPICEHDHYCSVSADGTVAKCMRRESGAFKTKEDKNGAPYYLHRLADGPRTARDIPPRPGREAKRADPDTLNAVYVALLGLLMLSKVHREALRGRGLTDEVIDRAGYRTLPGPGRSRIVRELHKRFGDQLLGVPGFILKEGHSGRYWTLRGPAGLIVPCRDCAGRIVALKVRRDADGGGPRYLYVSSAGHGGPGPGAPVHVPLGVTAPCPTARLTEGELKANLCFARTGLATLSVPGASNWRQAPGVLRELECRIVRLAFDADAWHKPTVAQALSGCAAALVQAGFAVELERWDVADGKGLDDLLAAGKAPELLQGDAALQAVREAVAAAGADEAPGRPGMLARVQDVLNAGGPEALFRDQALLQALADLASADPAAFAAVRAALRPRVSLRDLDRALGPFRRSGEPRASDGSLAYFEQNGCIHRNMQTPNGPVALCNFTARIVEDVVQDDGVEQTRKLAVQGSLAGGQSLPRVEVPAADFAGMGWVVPAWGTRAVVYAGQGTRGHVRTALQLLSGDVPQRTVYGHTGWRRIGGSWFYLHAGGAIGSDGLVTDIPVSLPEPLAGFRLPAPPQGTARADAVRASLGLLRLSSDPMTFPLLAAAYRAVLGNVDFGLHVAGATGLFKSEAAALAQQHYGASMDARHLPASWSSTANALEGLAFAAQDALLVVDDFCPTGSATDVKRHHKEADRLFRGQGNRAGRQRLRADASLRPAKPPRGLVLSTGEDMPGGQSLRARVLSLEVSPGDFGPQPPTPNPTLSACQQDAAAGLYAQSLAGFLRWVAPQLDAMRGRWRAELEALRDQARAEGQHARTPGIVADLALGLRYFLDYALAAGAMSAAEREELWRRGWVALKHAGAAQAAHLAAAEPTEMFLRLLSAAVASGRVHVAGSQGEPPQEPERWGWRLRPLGAGDHAREDWQPQGHLIGWLDGENVYLEPDAAYAEAQRLAGDQGESLPVTQLTLRRRLKEKGLLVTTDTARSRLTVRKMLQGERRDVLHIAWGTGTATAPKAASADPLGEAGRDNGPETRAGSWAGNGPANSAAAHRTAAAGTPGHSPAANGPEMGHLGRSDTGEEASAGENNPRQAADGWEDWQ